MFYIDFTAPDGHSYRVDLSETPITHLCPVCGNIEYFKLDDSDHYYWCADCRERREEQESMENHKKHREENVRRINKLCHSNIDVGTIEQWEAEAIKKNLSPAEELAFFKEKIDQLRSI